MGMSFNFLLATVTQFLIYISAMRVPEWCAICKHPVDSGGQSASTLGEKESLAINQASNSRKDSIHTVPGEKVHKDCRHKYCKPDQIAKDTKQEESKPSTSSDRHVLRSSEEGFYQPSLDGRNTMSCKSRPKDTLLATCCERADSWSARYCQSMHSACA